MDAFGKIKSTRIEALKIERYTKISLYKEFTKIDKILKETTNEHGQKLMLI